MITGTETAPLLPRTTIVTPDVRLPVVEAKVAADLNLRDGQIVQATLQTGLQALRLDAWDLRLPLTAAQAGILARAMAPSSESLKLQVQVLPNGTIVLRPLQQAPPSPSTAQIAPDAAQASRVDMLSLRPGDLRAFADLLKPGVLDSLISNALPPDSQARQKLLNSLRLRLGSQTLSAHTIRSWVKNSGLNAEHDLDHGKRVSPADFKLGLRALLEELSPEDVDDNHRLHQALDDLEASQLMSSQSLMGKEWVLSLVLPFRDANPVFLRFSRSRQPDDPSAGTITIQLHTDLDPRGDIWLQTHIQAQRQVDMVMWATDAGLAQQAQAHAADLAHELESMGLTMTSLQVIHGKRPDETVLPAANVAPELGNLLDLRT
jgi:hypothetical protein